MADNGAAQFATFADVSGDLLRLGLRPGDTVMVHAAVSRAGPVLGDPDTIIAALREVIGPQGTIVAYTDWSVSWSVNCYRQTLRAPGPE